MRWCRAGKRDFPKLLDFLLTDEWRAAAYTSRLKRQGRKSFPSPLEASILFCMQDNRMNGTMMLTSSGLLLPVFSSAEENGPALPPAPFPGWGDLATRLYSMMGPSREVGWLAGQLPLVPLVTVDYHLMVQQRDSLHDDAMARGWPKRHSSGLTIRPAGSGDLAALLPLQVRYELEEVVINKKRYSEQACRQNLNRALRQQIVLLAERDGRVVAKAGTNARGFLVDQIGGVFTTERERNTGIAQRVMLELLRIIYAEKHTACLFVKKSNLPALSLYKKLGFRVGDGYKICYFRT
jgi:hypothetical protein